MIIAKYDYTPSFMSGEFGIAFEANGVFGFMSESECIKDFGSDSEAVKKASEHLKASVIALI